MDDPLFSIIMPTYQRTAMLEEALASVLAQTVDDWECIVVDDASPRPAEVPADSRFRCIRHVENRGPVVGLNTGIDAATGRYVVFCDDDDILTPERLSIASEGLARAPVTVCWNTVHDDRAHTWGRALEGDVHDEILDATTPSMGVTAVRRDVLVRLDERYEAAYDLEWWLRMSERADVTTVSRVGFVWRRHYGPRGRVGLEARLAGRRRLLDEHADYFATHRRARAFQYRRLGMQLHALGDRELARRAFAKSLAARPDARAARDLARTNMRNGERPAAPENSEAAE